MTDLKLVTTTEDPRPACPCATEPCIVTGPNDPCSVNVQLGDPEDVVYVTFNFHDGRTLEITLDEHRADHIGGLLKKATAMVEERNAAEMAAWAATLPAPCPLHDGPSVEGTRCTCDGVTDAHGNRPAIHTSDDPWATGDTDRCIVCSRRFSEADAATDSITDTCSDCLSRRA